MISFEYSPISFIVFKQEILLKMSSRKVKQEKF